MKINPVFSGAMLSVSFGPDEEHRRIMRKLMAYGYRSTGSKSGDKELLRRIELKQVEMENCVSSKYLTVSRTEQEKILEDKKIIILRYFRDKTQREIADVLGVSQVQISRLENKILTEIKNKMVDAN